MSPRFRVERNQPLLIVIKIRYCVFICSSLAFCEELYIAYYHLGCRYGHYFLANILFKETKVLRLEWGVVNYHVRPF